MERPNVALATTTPLLSSSQLAVAPVAAASRFNPQDLWPKTWEETLKMAVALAKSSLLPKHLHGNVDSTFYTILAGLELGVAPLVACREIYLVDGRPSCSSLLKVGLVRGSGICDIWQEVKSSNEECVYQARRLGDKGATVRSFSIKDAERAQLLGKDNWKKYPAAMLRRRCQGQLADDLFPDIVKGLGSSDDSAPLGDGEVRWAERTSPPPVPQLEATGTLAVIDGEHVNQKTAEVVEIPQGLSFEQLSELLGSTTTREGLQDNAKKVEEAKKGGKLTPDQVGLLTEIYKAKRKALEGGVSHG